MHTRVHSDIHRDTQRQRAQRGITVGLNSNSVSLTALDRPCFATSAPPACLPPMDPFAELMNMDGKKDQSAFAIISPMSKKLLGTAAHDADLLEGGLSKEVTDPRIVRCVDHHACIAFVRERVAGRGGAPANPPGVGYPALPPSLSPQVCGIHQLLDQVLGPQNGQRVSVSAPAVRGLVRACSPRPHPLCVCVRVPSACTSRALTSSS